MSEMPTNENTTDETELENSATDDDATTDQDWKVEAEKWKEQAEKWKALSRKNEKTLRDTVNSAPKVAGSNDEVITQLQSALEESKAEIAKFQKKTMISETLKLYNLPDEAELLLRGDNEEELEKSAEALKKLLGIKATPPVISTQGKNSGTPKKSLTEEEELALYLKNRNK